MTDKFIITVLICTTVAAAGMKVENMRNLYRTDIGVIAENKIDFRDRRKPDEMVRVYIKFNKEEVDKYSLDELIDRICCEVPDGKIDVHNRNLQGYDITANVCCGAIEEIRNVNGVETVKREKQYSWDWGHRK